MQERQIFFKLYGIENFRTTMNVYGEVKGACCILRVKVSNEERYEMNYLSRIQKISHIKHDFQFVKIEKRERMEVKIKNKLFFINSLGRCIKF